MRKPILFFELHLLHGLWFGLKVPLWRRLYYCTYLSWFRSNMEWLRIGFALQEHLDNPGTYVSKDKNMFHKYVCRYILHSNFQVCTDMFANVPRCFHFSRNSVWGMPNVFAHCMIIHLLIFTKSRNMIPNQYVYEDNDTVLHSSTHQVFVIFCDFIKLILQIARSLSDSILLVFLSYWSLWHIWQVNLDIPDCQMAGLNWERLRFAILKSPLTWIKFYT